MFTDCEIGPFCQLPDATPEQIKKAYYNCMKTCHPDLSGNDPETTNFCTFINEVYEVVSFFDIFNFILEKFVVSIFLTIAVQVLSDPIQRRVYDDIHGYSFTSINPFVDDSSPKDHVFVDEFSCIGNFKSLW
jgi:DnaJ-class molecular chaperone